jgi:hypothetical protein
VKGPARSASEEQAPHVPAAWLHPVWLLLIALGGFLVGVGILLFGYEGTKRSIEFVRSNGFAVWAVVIGAQTAYWAVVSGPLWANLTFVWKRTPPGHASTLALAAALILILVVFPLVSIVARNPWPLWGHSGKIRVLTIIGGLAVGVPALMGIALIQRQVNDQEAGPVDKDDVPAALEARSQILWFLSVAGAVIGLAVLAAGALRNATVPPGFVKEDRFPAEAVLLYGAFFTGLLLLVYVPAHRALRRLGARIRDHYFPLSEMPAPDDDGFRGWLDKRANLETVLQLNVTPSQQLLASLFILAPLLSAVLTSLVPKTT